MNCIKRGFESGKSCSFQEVHKNNVENCINFSGDQRHNFGGPGAEATDYRRH